MVNVLNSITSNQQLNNFTSDFESSFKIDSKERIKPLQDKAELLPSKIIGSPIDALKDLKNDLVNVGKAAKGEANDYELGRINGRAIQGSSVLIGGYLFYKNPFKLSKVMQLVGFGTFLGSMWAFPKLFIQLPLKMKTGIDYKQEYVDSQGRKKLLYQDPQYKLDILSKDELNKIGNKMGVNEKLPDRDNYIKQRIDKTTLQANTVENLMSGFAAPTMSALVCNRIEKVLKPAIEKHEIKKSEQALENLPSVNGKEMKEFTEFLTTNKDKRFSTIKQKIIDDFFTPILDRANARQLIAQDNGLAKGSILQYMDSFGIEEFRFETLESLFNIDLSQQDRIEHIKKNIERLNSNEQSIKITMDSFISNILSDLQSLTNPNEIQKAKDAETELVRQKAEKDFDEYWKIICKYDIDNKKREKMGLSLIESVSNTSENEQPKSEQSRAKKRGKQPTIKTTKTAKTTKTPKTKSKYKESVNQTPAERKKAREELQKRIDAYQLPEEDLEKIKTDNRPSYIKGKVEAFKNQNFIEYKIKRAMKHTTVEGVSEKITKLYEAINEFSNQRAALIAYVENILSADCSFASNQWEKFCSKFMGALNIDNLFSTTELEKLKNGDKNLIGQKINGLVSNEQKLNQTVKDLMKIIDEYENKTQSLIDIDSKSSIYDRARQHLEEINSDIAKQISVKGNPTAAGTLQNAMHEAIISKVVAEKSVFYRTIQLLDVLKQSKDGVLKQKLEYVLKNNGKTTDKQTLERLEKTCIKILMEANTVDYIEKNISKGYNLDENEYKAVMDVLYNPEKSNIENILKHSSIIRSDADRMGKNYKQYLSDFREYVINFENDVKPEFQTRVLDGKKHNKKIFGKMNDLIGKNVINLIIDEAQGRYNTKKWMLMFGGLMTGVVSVTETAVCLLGRKSKTEKMAEEALRISA